VAKMVDWLMYRSRLLVVVITSFLEPEILARPAEGDCKATENVDVEPINLVE